MNRKCPVCNKPLNKKQKKYCSHKCSAKSHAYNADFCRKVATERGGTWKSKIYKNSSVLMLWGCGVQEHPDFEKRLADILSDGGWCPYCSGHKTCISNSLATLNPELAEEWDCEKNGDLTPNDVTPSSNRNVWWKCREEGCRHSWQARVYKRNKGEKKCFECWSRHESLAATRPELAAKWHPTKNGNRTPFNTAARSNKKFYFICPECKEAYSSSTGQDNNPCPFCNNRIVNINNCLATKCPNMIKDWDYKKNGNLTPYDVVPTSQRIVHWICSSCKESYKQAIRNKCVRGYNPPCCSRLIKKVTIHNCLAAKHPELVDEWDDENDKTPYDFSPGSKYMAQWVCKINPLHKWITTVSSRTSSQTGCPQCQNNPSELRFLYAIQWLSGIRWERHNKTILDNGQHLDLYCQLFGIGIECHGTQHYEPVKFFGGKSNFDLTINRDEQKREVAQRRIDEGKLNYFFEIFYNELQIDNNKGRDQISLTKLIFRLKHILKESNIEIINPDIDWQYFNPVQFVTYSEASMMVQKAGFKDQKEYQTGSKNFSKGYKEFPGLPCCPNKVYAGIWKGWEAFLGKKPRAFSGTDLKYLLDMDLSAEQVSNKIGRSRCYIYKARESRGLMVEKKVFLSYAQAHISCIKLKIKTKEEYFKRYKEHPNLPGNPASMYKKEWKGWKEFLGTASQIPSLSQPTTSQIKQELF